MNLGLVNIKKFANYNGYKSILRTDCTKVNNIRTNLLTLDKTKILNDKKTEMALGKIIGTAKVQNRDTYEFSNINIRESKMISTKHISLEYQGKSLFNGSLINTNNELGMFIVSMIKNSDEEKFCGLAKLFDQIAVKKSANTASKGNVFLYASEGGLDETFALAEPIHWSRGYIDVNHLLQPRPYDAKMEKLFNLYKEERKNGTSINDAKKAMNLRHQDETTMVLKNDRVKEHLKETTMLELF